MEIKRAEFLIKRINDCPFNAANGIYAVSVEDGRAMIAVTLSDHSKNIWGIPHGGLLYTLGDVACGLAVQSVHDGQAVTVSGTMNYLRAAGKGAQQLTSVGSVIKSGHSMAFVQVEIFDNQNTLLAAGQYVAHLS